ncbi:uncharacterized protein [Medicago truncatula]|uniref:uncharacterized protein isoform X1 n=1 Tax=Medicago truncatula TaxID=3880 RepID=UPI000D2F30E5|nr:uncharacterized protein LOC25488180 isoform X1 [Medicago truncatula]XP_024633184.1 uncharacterized protein LOC25488180 isoform X1 [Medicago truncatula]
MAKEIETLTEDERRALRGSKFAPLPILPNSHKSKPRLAHPGGPVATNKAAALAKFLERKLKEPNGLASINPDLLEVAVKNAKQTVSTSNGGTSNSKRNVRHVESFGDSDASEEEQNDLPAVKECKKKKKKKKEKKKNKKRKDVILLG